MADSISSPDKDVIHRESHGLRDDLDEDTPVDDVKAPNVFERAKEEIEAIVEAIHPKKDPKTDPDSSSSSPSSSFVVNWDSINAESKSGKSEEKDGKGQNFIEKTKEEVASLVQKTNSPHHHNETHGRNDDIDENTNIDEVKGPNMFVRAKEEIEALVGAIHSKKESSDSVATPKKHDGLGVSIGKGLEKIFSPRSRKHDD